MGHDHTTDVKGSKLLFVTLLNLTITITEFAGGLISNSLALLSDALHNLGDTTAILIAFVANRVSKRKSNLRKTFGFKRIEILAALLNAVLLLVICVYLIFEAWDRFQDPSPVKGKIMLIVAVIGLLANFISVLVLHGGKNKNINIKAAYMHLLGDTLSSVVVITGGILIFFFNIFWLDPLITILISIYIFKEAVSIIRETIDILMQNTPGGLDLNEVISELQSFPEVKNIHHVHAWNLDDQQIHFECHVDMENDLHLSETNKIRNKLAKVLLDRFNIVHTTIQIEYDCCADKSLVHNQPF